MENSPTPAQTNLAESILPALLIIFVVVPIIEMWVLIEVGSAIGAFYTIALVFLTAFVGIGLLRIQGAGTLASARQKLAANELPAREMADGVFYVIAGILLITPGFVTDVVGFACLTPGIRTLVIYLLINHLLRSLRRGGGFRAVYRSAFKTRTRSSDRVIDGDFERHPDASKKNPENRLK